MGFNMSAKHTPGPWLSHNGDESIGNPYVYVSGGEVLAVTNWAYDETELRANARLIAAAPDLLAVTHALQALVDEWEEPGHDDDEPRDFIAIACEIGKQARAAIAKATGE